MDAETLPSLVHAALVRGRQTSIQLAEAIGVHRVTLHRWAAGRRVPPPRYRADVARALGVSRRRLDSAIDATERAQEAT